MERVAATSVEVLVGVRGLGVKIGDQAVSFAYSFGIQDVTDSLDHSTVNLVVGLKQFISLKKTIRLCSLCGQMVNISSIYLHPIAGLLVTSCKRSFSSLP